MRGLHVLGPYSTQFLGSSVPRRGSTAIATVRQASTQAPRIVSSTQKTSMYLNYDNKISANLNVMLMQIVMCHV